MACVAIADNPTAAAIRTEVKNLFIRSLPERLPSSPPDIIGVPYWSQWVGRDAACTAASQAQPRRARAQTQRPLHFTFKRRSATPKSVPRLPPQPKASFVLWDFAKNWDDCFDHFALSWVISLIEHRRVLLFSRTWWPRDHYDCAALLTSMNDVPFLLGGLHCHQADRTRLRRLNGQRPVHARL